MVKALNFYLVLILMFSFSYEKSRLKTKEVFDRNYWLGTWDCKGYTCWNGGPPEEITITYSGDQFTAVKNLGDNCVRKGKKTFWGKIDDQIDTNKRVSVTFQVGSPGNPESGTSGQTCNIHDMNSFTCWGIKCTRKTPYEQIIQPRSNVQYIPGGVQYIPGEVQYIPGEVQYIPGEVQYIPGEVQYIPGDVQYIPGGVQYIPGDVQYIYSDVQYIPGDVQYIPGGVQYIPGDVQYIPGGVQYIPGGVQYIPGQLILFPGTIIRIQSSNFPNNFIRHRGFEIWSENGNGDMFIKDSTYIVRPALNGKPGHYSFESVNYPGRFIRVQNWLLFLHENDNSGTFKNDASFSLEKARNGKTDYYSIMSSNNPDYFVRHQGSRCKLHKAENGNTYNQDSSWKVVIHQAAPAPAPAPIPIQQPVIQTIQPYFVVSPPTVIQIFTVTYFTAKWNVDGFICNGSVVPLTVQFSINGNNLQAVVVVGNACIQNGVKFMYGTLPNQLQNTTPVNINIWTGPNQYLIYPVYLFGPNTFMVPQLNYYFIKAC